MQVRDALSSGEIAGSDKEVLLAALLGKGRTWLLAHSEYELNDNEEEKWREWADRRQKGEPVAYITGFREFFGRTFSVDASTLIPRPATERLCEIALDLLRKKSEPITFHEEIDQDIVASINIWKPLEEGICIADIGTGSGCIAATLACECPGLRVLATDISADALEMAERNASVLGVGDRIAFKKGKNLGPFIDIKKPFLIVSNPPYIPNGTNLEKEVKEYEPHTALFSGDDGATTIKEMIAEAKENPYCVGYIIECRRDQLPLF